MLHEVDIDAQIIEEFRCIDDQELFLRPNYPFYVPMLLSMGDLEKYYLYIVDLSDNDIVAINLSLGMFKCLQELLCTPNKQPLSSADLVLPSNPYRVVNLR
jgi:hypothetical protein